MTLDIRANVICDLGTVISGGFSDDHIQGTGLVRTRGDLVLEGLITARTGDEIQLAYEKDGHVSRFPRALRVLSSFADPFHRQTTISMGCKLTMLEDFRETEDTNPAEDDDNGDLSCEEFAKVPLNISFRHLASICIEKLGLTLDPTLDLATLVPGSIASDSYDFSSGYVNILSDLLYSHSLIGYLDAGEILHIVDISTFDGTHALITEDDIIDINPIRSGDIPADTVYVEYSYNRFKEPDNTELGDAELREKRDWELDVVQGELEHIYIDWDEGENIYRTSYYPLTITRTEYDAFDRKLKSTTTTRTVAEQLNSAYIASLLQERGHLTGATTGYVEHTETEELIYKRPDNTLFELPDAQYPCTVLFVSGTRNVFDPDKDSQPIARRITRYESDIAIVGALNLPSYVFIDDSVLHPGNTQYPVEVQYTTYESNEEEGISKEITQRKLAYGYTQQGQQGFALATQDIETASDAFDALVMARSLRTTGTSIQLHQDRYWGVQRRPGIGQRTKEQFAKDPRVSESAIEFIQGGPGTGIVTTYSLPFVPDDAVYWEPSGNRYRVQSSSAEALAAKFGRTQQRLVFGHRNGFSTQLTPNKLPPYPATPIAVNFDVVVGEYLVNGQSWTFDSNGIVANADLLYVGGVGTTDVAYTTPSPWSPVQDGITALPAAPTITTNSSPAPANSVTTPTGFDATNPGTAIWTSLPTDSDAVFENEITIDAPIPPYEEVMIYSFALKAAVGVVRTFISIPIELDVALAVKSEMTVDVIDRVEVVSLPVRCIAPADIKDTTFVDLATKAEMFFTSVPRWYFYVTNTAPQGGSSVTTSTPTGWTEVFNGNTDDQGVTVGPVPFDLLYNGTTYNYVYVSPNGYITFGGTSQANSGFSSTYPALNKIFINTGDFSMQKLFVKYNDIEYRIRVEGNTDYTGAGTSTYVYEIAFIHADAYNGIPAWEIRLGDTPVTSGLMGCYSAYSSLDGYPVPSIAADTTYVVVALNDQATEWGIASGYTAGP